MNFVTPAVPMEAWNWCYNVSIFLSGLMLFGAVVAKLPGAKYDLPNYILFSAGAGLLYAFGFPFNILLCLCLHLVMTDQGASPAAAIFSAVFTASSWA